MSVVIELDEPVADAKLSLDNRDQRTRLKYHTGEGLNCVFAVREMSHGDQDQVEGGQC